MGFTRHLRRLFGLPSVLRPQMASAVSDPSARSVGGLLRLGPPGSVRYKTFVLVLSAALFLNHAITNRVVTSWIMAVGLAVLALRTLFVSLNANGEGVEVRNIFRTHRLPWCDICDVIVEERHSMLLGAGYGAAKKRVCIVTQKHKIRVSASETTRYDRLKVAPFGVSLADRVGKELQHRLAGWRAAP